MTIPKTKLGILPEIFKLITVTGAVPEQPEFGGPIRNVSILGEQYDADALCCLHKFCKQRLKRVM